MSGYDVLGNIAIVKFSRGTKAIEKKRFGEKFLKSNNSVTTILEKTGKISGRLRTSTTKFVAGIKTKEALYKENGCSFLLNVDTCYFSPRLSSERKEIAEMVKPGEHVLVMFGGVGPFAITIGKLSSVAKVVSVELGREPSKYAKMNVKRNKLVGRVEIVQGDVRKKVNGKFDRVVMARPNLKDSFLDVGFKAVKPGGIIHYYGFYAEKDIAQLNDLIFDQARKAGKKARILQIKKAGDIGVREFRWRADLRISG
jgi:tRNA (guanine37-N1)-methyltransferase